MFRNLHFVLMVLLVFSSCKEKVEQKKQAEKSLKMTATAFDGWHHKDLKKDSLPGISLDRVYEELITEDSGQEIIVALIDSPVDIDHEDLKDQIYVNTKEIPGNGKDDDNNGYVDDIHGWNFLGYQDNKTIQFANYDYIRVLRRLAPIFEGRDSSSIIETDDKLDYEKYKKALKLKEEDVADIQGELEYHIEERKKYYACVKAFPELVDPKTGVFDKEKADSLTPKTDTQKELLTAVQDFAYYGAYPELLDVSVAQGEARSEKVANLDYNERLVIGDDIYDLDDVRGHGNIDAPQGRITHGTQVAGSIAATRNNEIGIKGVSDKIKLMVLSVFPERGNELDKDVANAIRYAVDNGARIINYSHGRYFVDKEEILMDAIKYAGENDVLIISAAGNTPINIDIPENSPHPKDNPNNGDEIVDNLIKVGATGKNPDYIKPYWSSYGKRNVDFFAPGQRIMTTNSGSHSYFELGGSSLSCGIASGVAALLLSHYPNLSSRQVKEILIKSGESFDTEIKIEDDIKSSFQDLSKSGKVLNAYNAMIMAEEVSNSN